MRDEMQMLIKHINRKDWSHVTPQDPRAYQERGKFFASTYVDAEFYGRPNDVPEKVSISTPLVGTNATIERRLFGRVVSHLDMEIKRRFALDAKMRKAALQQGYDSIVLMSQTCYRHFRKAGKIPRNIELNVLNLRCMRNPKTHGTV